MIRRRFFFLAIATLAALTIGYAYQQTTRPAAPPAGKQTKSQPPTSSAGPESTESQRALLDEYCVVCHNQQLKTAGLMLDKLDLSHVGNDAQTWEKVIRKLRGGMMPPLGSERPENEDVYKFVSWLENSLDRAAANKPEPGRASLHRLNRTEYGNAIRDLLDLDVDVAALLPADDESDGFDNIADVLKVSPSLLEQYLAASAKISSLAVGDPGITPVSSVVQIPPDLAQDGQIEGLPLGSRGGVLIHYNFPLDGKYDFSVGLLQNIVGYLTGLEYPHQLEISIDGKQVFLTQVGGEADNKMSDANLGIAKDTIDARLKKNGVPVTAGPHDVTVTFLRRNSAASDEPLQLFTRDHDLQNMNGIPLIEHVQISGPYEATGPGDTPSRRRIFTCHPKSANDELACARQILSTLAKRAYRRPVSSNDLEILLSFYQKSRNKNGFDAGIESSLRLVLTDPKFLFRSEVDPANVSAGSVYRLGDMELASRLAFFLWSSIPDDQLIEDATQGKLKDPAGLNKEVKRMLTDPKAEAVVKNFAGQWLFLRNLQSVTPDPDEFPNFDDNLRQAFRKETELFFGSVIREDRNVMDLINADYTFVNERLAKHYGIPNIYGDQFRRVKIPGDYRRGLLGQGSVLTVTSEANRTSPVKRGKWILENIMGTPPPAPPPNVPALKDNTDPGKAMSVRARMEEHRKNPTCATCHAVLDPLGFSLENFDGIGQWRTREPGGLVDPSGQLADGTKVAGPVELRAALNRHPEQFVRTMTEKLMTYALGRGLEYNDMPVVRGIEKDAAKNGYRFSAIVEGIIKSTPFEMKRKAATEVRASR